MLISKKWLQDFIVEALPETEKLVDGLIMHVFEVEGVEKKGDDETLDVKVLPDRNHYALSHRGMAKEVAAIFNLTFKDDIGIKNLPQSSKVSVRIEDEKLCRRYCAARIEGVSVGESPAWLKERLEAVGQKSINNIVDATNYVMFSLGQPLHAFDADKVKGGIEVRAGKEGETLSLLDASSGSMKDRVIELGKGECVIADDSGPLVLAGIKGGATTAISSDTKNIILEAANFDPVVTRKFSTLYNLRSETSKRFENEITPDYAWEGLHACVDLILKIAGGEVEGILDVYPHVFPVYKIGVSASEISRLLGVDVPDSEIRSIFRRLGFQFEKVKPLEKVLPLAPTMLNIPYLYGSYISKDAPHAFDCSALVSWLYIQGGVSLPRISADQYFATERVEKENLQPGDLVFSDTGIMQGVRRTESPEYVKGQKLPRVIDHVGMYLGDGKILHTTRTVGHSLIEDLDASEKFKDVVGYGRMKNIGEERYLVTVPSERFDIRIKEDLIEEVGRLYGYHHVEARRPELTKAVATNKRFVVETIIREHLIARGFSEVYSYMFQAKGEVELANAYASDKAFMRKNLSDQLSAALETNVRYADLLGLSKIKMFEIGTVFTKKGEENRLGIAVAHAKKIKGENAETEIANAAAGLYEALQIAKKDMKSQNGVIELDVNELIELAPDTLVLPPLVVREVKKYQPVSPYPFVVRDVAVWASGEGKEQEIENIIKAEAGDLLKRLTQFDVFSKDGKTSYAYRLVLQSAEKTLEESEITDIMERITIKLNAKEGWQVR